MIPFFDHDSDPIAQASVPPKISNGFTPQYFSIFFLKCKESVPAQTNPFKSKTSLGYIGSFLILLLSLAFAKR